MERMLGLIVLAGAILVASLVFLGPRSTGSDDSERITERSTEDRTFAWRFATKEAEGDLPPRTQVALITNGQVYDLGEYAGSCAELSGEQRLADEAAGALCWWAGVGDELGVFLENGQYVVKRGIQEEPTAESEGFRGDFKELVTLK